MVGRRLPLAATGLSALVVYLAAGYLALRLAAVLWANRPDPLVAVAVVVLTALLVGYLSYRAGVARLRRSLDAVELPYARAPGVHHRLDRLTDRMGVARPQVLLADLAVPNAFAIGGGDGAIVVDRRLLGLLTGEELEALLAHELAHLETNDALVQTLAYSLAQTFAGLLAVAVLPVAVLAGGLAQALAMLAGRPAPSSRSVLVRVQRLALGAVAVVGALILLVGLAYSRRREWAADERAARVTDPLALARALRKIQRAATPDLGPLTPLYVHGEDDALTRLLSTHPPMDDRIERLRERARDQLSD